MRISGPDAWNALIKGQNTRWSDDIARFGDSPPIVRHTPKFLLSSADAIFCFGSCFARNIEEHLIYNDINVLSKKILSPEEEHIGARVNAFVNKFTTHSILNEIEWAVNPPTLNDRFFEETANGWLDLQLVPGIRPVTLERALARRSYLINDYFSRLRTANVVLLTLGLNETWKDERTGRYLNAAPSFVSVRREPERYSLELTDVSKNVAALEQIYATLSEINADARLIITVSPVPLGETFSGKDVVVANTASKATLRCAAESVASNHSNVDYFPSFDMVASAPRTAAYGKDCLHVTDQAVEIIVGYFIRLYMDRKGVEIAFREDPYLSANPDVNLAVRRGEFTSGYEHWVSFGKGEGRALRPPMD